MKEIRQRVRVREDGRIEITDPSLRAGVEVVVSVTAGDGAPAAAQPAEAGGGGILTFEELEALPPLPLDQAFGIAPSGRTAEEIDRDLRALRDEWDDPFARRS